MQQASAISHSSYGRTLGVAGWILGVAAAAEIIAGGIALVDRGRHNPPLTIQVPPPGLIAESTQPALPAFPAATRPQPAFNDPFESITKSTPAPKLVAVVATQAPPAPIATPTPAVAMAPKLPPAPAATPPAAALAMAPAPAAPTAAPALPAPTAAPAQMAALPKPTPVDETRVTMPESRMDGLLAEARALRQRGDMSTAITRLREALAISPKNALVIAELAGTYEKMNLQDKALEQWRTIFDMGESAGIYYQAADAKLKAAELAQQPPAQAASPGAATSPEGGSPTADSNGFQPGSALALVNLSTVEKPETSEGYKRFTLKIPVKRRPDGKINVSGVVIQVFFYDQLGDDSIVRTNANVSSHWSTLPADWQQEDIEILEVDYTQAAPEPGKIEEGRHYYGYVVCVYYNKALQDQTADPQSLLKTYPPPLNLPDKGG